MWRFTDFMLTTTLSGRMGQRTLEGMASEDARKCVNDY